MQWGVFQLIGKGVQSKKAYLYTFMLWWMRRQYTWNGWLIERIYNEKEKKKEIIALLNGRMNMNGEVIRATKDDDEKWQD